MAPFPSLSRDAVIQAYLKLSTTNVSDALDRLQLRGAPHGILPLWPGCQKIVGRAMTMKLLPQGSSSPVLGTLEALVVAQPGDVLVIDQGGRMDVNSFGGIAMFTAVKYGLVGVVIDGVTRDVDDMKAQGFAAYGRGIIQQSIRNRCAFAGHSIEVQIGGCSVRRGDLVMGDDNGIVIVPQGHIAEALGIAQQCAATEET
ncbi:MAG TPA: RraA family protein, partial [Candidatus Tectomicrobia bacterium]|nr:RraA family protein [Candidatus Tectomicrobia bacterium]